MARSPRECATKGCEKRTERPSGKCRTCDPPPSVNGLYGGRWVSVRGVARWVSDDDQGVAA